MTRALLIGATGLVGQSVIDVHGTLDLVTLSRRPIGPHHPGAIIAGTADWPALIADRAPDVLISCLGTTIKAAGSQAAFGAVDHDLVLAAARAACAAGTRHMITVSSVGASAASRNFYLRTKGDVEAALQALGFVRLDILRPGLLTGARTGPARPGEALAMLAAPLTDRLLHGPLRRYRSIAARDVARAIVALALRGGEGTHRHEHDAICRLAD